jgi:uncharacterized phage protein (TIGR02218 family)
MKNLVSGLQDHLNSRTTTMCYCWKVTRVDGTVQGFTEHDEDVTFDGVTYLAESGITASRIQQSLGLAADNLNIEGALSSATINEDDLAAGLYDNADLTLYWVNYVDPSERVTVDRGNIGEVQRMETMFSTEFRSRTQRLNQTTGRQYQRTCDAVLGDARCGVNLSSSTYRGTGTISSASGRTFVVSGIGAYASGFFTGGVLTFTSGANDDLSFEVKEHDGSTVTLWDVPPETVAASDGFRITAGCDHTAATCKAKFSNFVNFRGFPHIPGNDLLTSYASNEDEPMNGGSFFR